MTIFLVTVRLLCKDSSHDPQAKKTGQCAFSDSCTDKTGEHHTFATLGTDVVAVRGEWAKRALEAEADRRFRVTRVEEARWLT
jgi:hypothetical protein